MKRKVFIFTIILLAFTVYTAFASDDTSTQEINVGLLNMKSSSIAVTLNGDYTYNINNANSDLETGTQFNLDVSNGYFAFNYSQLQSITLVPKVKTSTMQLAVGAKKYSYMGTMTFKVVSGKILPINKIDVEDYIKGVVGYEMSNSYPLEALKAQAVATRNYALANIGKHKKDGFDLCDTTDCQVYRGYNAYYKNVIQAVDETRGLLLKYNDKLVCAYFSASDGGYTEASGNVWKNSLGYLITKKDEYDNQSWPYGDMHFKTSAIDKLFKSKKYINSTDTFKKINLASIKKYPSGRLSSIEIIYTDANKVQKTKTFTKDATRYFLSLPSSMYNITYDSAADDYKFSGKGYGHGVGMSQIGARNRAKGGQTFEMILSFYYDGSYIDNTLGITITPGPTVNPTDEPNITTLPTVIPTLSPTISPTAIPTINPTAKPTANPSVNPTNNPNQIGVDTENKGTASTIGNAKKSVILKFNFTRVLKLGMKGSDVTQLQKCLSKLGFFKNKTYTLNFGKVTQTAVKAFQSKNKIKATGILDKNTALKINTELAKIKY